jgi:acetolactate synthase-1/2/3 large subunit
LHPQGHASRSENPGVSFSPPPDYAAIAAAAGGALARKITAPADLDPAIAEALHTIRQKNRSAVLDVVVTPL